MRILLAHNTYKQAGGEDAVFQHERALLEQYGHEITAYTRDNAEIEPTSLGERIDLARRTIWNQQTADELSRLIRRVKPEIAHFTNTFPLISPAAYDVCQAHGVPVVQTVQNYRLICPKSSLLRDGDICERCIGKRFAWPSMVHKCYHDSIAQTGVIALMLAYHNLRGTWQRQVDRYVAATQFSKDKLVEGGLPRERIVVKPNFLAHDPGARTELPGGFAMFVGRLTIEKGIHTLLQAWRRLPNIPLKIFGDGPLREEMSAYVSDNQMSNVDILGWRSNADILEQMKRARFLVFPSEWYEGFPVTIVEAFACGIPVIASKLGSMAEVIEPGVIGAYVRPGDAEDIAEQVSNLWQNPEHSIRMGHNARTTYLERYTAARNYKLLIDIYSDVLAQRRR